jgi:hypothetical protein
VPAASTGAVALLPGDYDVAVERAGFARAVRRVTLLVVRRCHGQTSRCPLAGVDVRTDVAAEGPLSKPRDSQPSSTVTKREVDAPRCPRAQPSWSSRSCCRDPGRSTSTVGRFAVTKFGGPADQRSGYSTLVDGGDGRRAVGQSDDQRQPGRCSGIQSVPRSVRRAVRPRAVGHRLGGDAIGWQQAVGSGFYFGRDDALNARYPFAAVKPPFDEHRVGGSAGGPLVRNRTHAFGAYERDTVHNVRVIALPPSNILAATENGIFPRDRKRCQWSRCGSITVSTKRTGVDSLQ